MNITTIQAPPFEPVTLTEVYLHLRLDPEGSPATHPDDAMLTRHIKTARAEVETITRRSLIQQIVRLSQAGFCQRSGIELPRPPLISVERVQYYDSDNALQTVVEADYFVTDDSPPRLRFVTAWAAPSIYVRQDAVRVEYVTGYSPDGSPATTQEEYAGNVPSVFKDAILLGVELLYADLTPEQRAATERARESLLYNYVIQLAL